MQAPETQPPLALYVHLPWCVSKCPYCDFNSHALAGELPARKYMDAVIADLDFALANNGAGEQRRFVSVFFGGGTPSLFPAEEIARVISSLRARSLLCTNAEISLEANPGTIERGHFSDFRAAGINRVSVGAQSFDPEKLRALGRIHGPADTAKAVAELAAAGIANFNIDLMFALPRQRAEQVVADLEQAVALSPTHISAYQLTIEPNTAFFRQRPRLPAEAAAADMQLRVQEKLADSGYDQYEVSAFARPGLRCRHNLNYWEYGDYMGIGAGAHQKLTDRFGRVWREQRRAHPGRYMREAGSSLCITQRREITAEERVFEFMLNALRLREGFDEELFASRTGLALDQNLTGFAQASQRGLLENHNGRWRASDLGWRFLNDLQALFLPTGEAA